MKHVKACAVWVSWAPLWPQERLIRTTVGRIIFNRALPPEIWFINELLDRKGVDSVVARCYKHLGRQVTADTVDNIKDMGFKFATRSGITIAVSDIQVPESKATILDRTSAREKSTPNNNIAVV